MEGLVPGTPRTEREQAEWALCNVGHLGKMSRFYREALEAYDRGDWAECVSSCDWANERDWDFRVKYGE